MRRLAPLLLAACADGPAVDADRPPPTLDAAAVTAEVEAALAAGLPEPIRPRDTLAELLGHRDGQCPAGPPDQYSFVSAFNGCEAQSGYTYAGITEYTGPRIAEDPRGGFHLLADGFIIDPEGDWFIFGGELELYAKDEVWETEVTGSFSYAPAGGWMTHEASIALWSGSDGAETWLEGGYGDGDGHSVYFEDLRFPAGCDGPVGVLKLREDSGYWHTLTFDEGCGGCAEAVFDNGEVVGEVCPDLSAPVAGLVAVMEG